MIKKGIIVLITVCLNLNSGKSQQQAFRNKELSVDERVNSLLNSLTLEEKISMLGYRNPGVERLQIPAYNWWNEALHGVARAGEATVFPQAIAMAATFDPILIERTADYISTEARGKYNIATKQNRRLQYMGLTFWTPNINIFRDPRWGRGQETYGEDPFLTAIIGSAFVRGLQGNNPTYLKTAACAKHFAVHSGPEPDRHHFNAIVDEKDMRETYLYAFKKLVDNDVEAIMCAYNRVNDQPCCTGETLLKKVLRDEWKFKGHVVTDCWALDDIWKRHKVIPTRVEVAAEAVKAGINIDCSNILQEDLMKAVEQKLLTEKDIDKALIPNLRTQIRLGLYDDPDSSPYQSYNIDSVHNKAHIEQARKVAQKSMVLLKNNGVLPLQKEKYSSLLVTGANAASIDVLLGNYCGISDNMITFVEGITRAAGPVTRILYDKGCDYFDTTHFGGIWASRDCDATIVILGLSPFLEGEEGYAFLSASGGDKADLQIPQAHIKFLKKLREAHDRPIITVVTTGSALSLSEIEKYSDAIILAWYPGEQGGNALADILFGEVSPSGRLPITFYNSVSDIPDYSDYNMINRTYRYFKGKVEYPFGYGLSYTSFKYDWSVQPLMEYKLNDTIEFSVKLKNTGKYDADEVVQVYIEYPPVERMPVKELKAFQRVSILKGLATEVSLAVPVKKLLKWDLSKNQWQLYSGKYKVSIGSSSQDVRLEKEFIIK